LPLPDRGLEFGDGLFETLLFENGKVLFPDLHWQRLQRGLQVLGFAPCIDDVLSQFDAIVLSHGEQWHRTALRVTVTRGPGPRGYAPPTDARQRVVISAAQLPGVSDKLPDAVTLSTAQTRWGCQPQLAGIKHCNRLEQVLAAAEIQRGGSDEVLMLGQDDQLVSVSAGNLFLRLGDELHTPVLNECGIDGTRRRLVIEQWAPTIGCPVQQSRLYRPDLEKATEVFYSNTLWGLRPVAAIDDLRWQSREMCAALYQQYRGACT
jgi:4-amino-4-deoxychorismate lyase